MSHNVSQPTNEQVNVDAKKIIAYYATEAGGELSASDLIPLTSGGEGFGPTRNVTRTPLHNGQDVVDVGSLQGGDSSVNVHLPASNEKMEMFRKSLKDGTPLIFNFFYKDGSGVAGYQYVTGIETPPDPNGAFFHTINLSNYAVNLIDPEPETP